MNSNSELHPSLFCTKCKAKNSFDSYAIDTHTCYAKHVFFFKCPECGSFSATAVANIPKDQWSKVMPNHILEQFIKEYRQAAQK